ncbi:hypothetical protein [Flavobacterium adhaerens]|uniref:hypothetical protein n=1 Tax=Flavobacterium adhaerens TaxID=3149043 RepID=UPI0032B3BDEA
MEKYQKISREDFMGFFRDTEKINELTVNDRIEIFRTILVGNSDITADLLNEILEDYCVSNLEVIDRNDEKK